MKRKIIILIIGLLLIGANVFAEGDLIVGGTIGIGTGTQAPSTYLQVVTDDGWQDAIDVNGTYRATPTSGTTAAAIGFETVASVNPASGGKSAVGASFVVTDMSDNDVSIKGGYFWMIMHGVEGSDSSMTKTKDQYGQLNLLETRSNVAGSTGTYTYSGDVVGGRGWFARGDNNRNFDYQRIRGFDVRFTDFGGGTGVVTYEDFKGLAIQQFPSHSYFKMTDFAGIWIASQPNVTGTAYGIVLDGEGPGSDIVFGEYSGSRPKIYAENGQLFARDYMGNVTLNSPHDPETGEWIYYSKNVKTGRVVKINMEKLVKAVEKLTGEKFMIETLEEIK